MRMSAATSFLALLVALAARGAAGFTPPASTSIATFGNSATKALIQAWQPRPLSVPSGAVFTPRSTDNLRRFVRARILLEDGGVGSCVHSSDDHLCVVLCRFSKAEHQVLLPLWHPEAEPSKVLENLIEWHRERFGSDGTPVPRLSGAHLEWDEDRQAWASAASP